MANTQYFYYQSNYIYECIIELTGNWVVYIHALISHTIKDFKYSVINRNIILL